MELSIVLISKNQAWNISRLIESVLRGSTSMPSREIILVDSASTDETVDLARLYPIDILRLGPDLPLSPAAGRYVGYKRSQGEFVLFLDGDMELVPGWLEHAVRAMRDQPDAALMLSNQMIELLPPSGPAALPPNEKVTFTAPQEVSRVSFVAGGAALYRRSVLEQVGTFNPYLKSDEEPELYLRIRHAGYRILQLDLPIVRHFSVPQETLSGLLGRRRRNFLLGAGQCIRYHLRTNLLWPYIKERGSWSLLAALWLAVGLVSLLLTLVTRDDIWFAAWTLALCLLLLAAVVRKRSLRRAFFSLFRRALMVEGLLKGFLMKPLPPDSYPCDVEVIKETSERPFFQPSPITFDNCPAPARDVN
ncbi:MAG: glycosyltransferase [Candidatus Acidiferrum sp.]